VPKNLDNLEKLLRILLLVELLRTLRPDLSAVGFGNLAGLASGEFQLRSRGRRKRAFDLPSSDKLPEAVVTALQAVVSEPVGLQGVQSLGDLVGGPGSPGQVGFRFDRPTTVFEGLSDVFNQQGFKVVEQLEPSEVPPRSVAKLLTDVLKDERTRETLCIIASPFLLKATQLPNAVVRGGALLGLAACGLEVFN